MGSVSWNLFTPPPALGRDFFGDGVKSHISLGDLQKQKGLPFKSITLSVTQLNVIARLTKYKYNLHIILFVA